VRARGPVLSCPFLREEIRGRDAGSGAQRPVWKSTSVSGALSHFSAMTRPSWLGRAVRNRHRHAIEQAARRWRGGRRDDSARTCRKILISTQAANAADEAARRADEAAPVRKSTSESGAISLSPFSAMTQPCWPRRAVIDHTATQSSCSLVDGVEAMIQQWRRRAADNLIYALDRTPSPGAAARAPRPRSNRRRRR
jgi:hypothetical protein